MLAAVIGIVVCIGGATIGYANLKERADQLQAKLTTQLQAGQRELEAGKASLTQANATHDANQVTQAIAHFGAAKAQFLAAAQFADDSRLLKELEKVPLVGELASSRHIAVDGIAGMGAALSDAGQDLSNLEGQLLRPSATGQAGRTLLDVLDQTHVSLIKVRRDLARASEAAARVDTRIVPGDQQATFVKARDLIVGALAGLDEFERLVPVLKDILGGNGARTYLVEQVNPAELRAGGGFIGTYSLVRAEQGALAIKKSGPAGELADPRPAPGQPGFVLQPDPLREIIPDISWSFLDSNLFPDFPSNALAAERWVEPLLKIRLDGVISIDYYTVAKMLELTGPLRVPGYDTTVDATTFIPFIFAHDFAQDATHRAIAAAIAGPLMERISALPPDRWPTLVGAFNELAIERHLQVYLNSGPVQKEIDRIGWSGNLNPSGAKDYMLEIESNYGGSKSNYFVSRHYTVTLTRNGNTLHHKVLVDLVNNTPHQSQFNVSYLVELRLYVSPPAYATSDNLIPVKYPNPAPPDGMLLLDGWLPYIYCCGGHDQAVFEYDTQWTGHDSRKHEIYWQKQPGTDTDIVDIVWNSGNSHTYTVSGDLSQDRIITLTATAARLTAGHLAQATLPSLSFG